MSDDYYKAVNDCAESQGVPSGDTSKYLKLVKDNNCCNVFYTKGIGEGLDLPQPMYEVTDLKACLKKDSAQTNQYDTGRLCSSLMDNPATKQCPVEQSPVEKYQIGWKDPFNYYTLDSGYLAQKPYTT